MGFIDESKRQTARVVRLYDPRTWREKGWLWTSGLMLLTWMVIVLVLGMYWSREPAPFEVAANTLARAEALGVEPVTGFSTTATVIRIADTLLDKPGGYLSNDLMPPGLYLDNIPNWEFGVLTGLRDVARSLRNDFSRSQSQSREDPDLVIAQPQFNYDSESWMLPSTEAEYRKGLQALERYLVRLSDPGQMDAQFFARADNLRAYLAEVERRLGSYTQRLSASVGSVRYDLALAADPAAGQVASTPIQGHFQTPWLELDDVFYEARGYTWALLHILQAIEVDFAKVLSDKNAAVSLRQIVRELDGAQQRLWSPMVLNGSGFGVMANHSLVMSSYVSRAHSAVTDLRDLLGQG